MRIRQHYPRVRDRVSSLLAEKIGACADGRKPWPLFLHGSAGGGKTCAALVLADRVASVLFYDFVVLCGFLQEAKMGRLISPGEYSDTVIRPDEYWTDWGKPHLCVVDEIGTRDTVTDHQYETLKAAIDHRFGKPLVLISNLDLGQMSRLFDDRIASRIGAGTVVLVDHKDMRLEKMT
jgi:DNA replication protein DnaC